MSPEQARLRAFASYMNSLERGTYIQTRDVHADGGASCLLAHAMSFLRPDLWRETEHPRHPRLMRETAAGLFGLEYGQTAFLYHAHPFGRGQPIPTAREAATMLSRLAADPDSAVKWTRIED